MAGKKGKSGGARPGAGRKPKPPETISISAQDPLDFLEAVMRDEEANPTLRVRAAIAAVQYRHQKKGEGGKGALKDDAAKVAGKGRFAPAAPPRLVVDNKK